MALEVCERCATLVGRVLRSNETIKIKLQMATECK